MAKQAPYASRFVTVVHAKNIIASAWFFRFAKRATTTLLFKQAGYVARTQPVVLFSLSLSVILPRPIEVLCSPRSTAIPELVS